MKIVFMKKQKQYFVLALILLFAGPAAFGKKHQLDARQKMVQDVTHYLDSIVRKTKNETSMQVVTLFKEACLGYPGADGHFKPTTPCEPGRITIAPVLAADTATLYPLLTSNFRIGIPRRSGSNFVFIPQHSHYYVFFYMMRLFEIGYSINWEKTVGYLSQDNPRVRYAKAYAVRRAQMDILDRNAPKEYRAVFNRCVDSIQRATPKYLRPLVYTFATSAYVTPACRALGPVASEDEAQYREHLLWVFAVLTLISNDPSFGSVAERTQKQIDFLHDAENL